MSSTKGSLTDSAVGASTSTAVCPGPMKPGAAGGVVMTDEMRRLEDPTEPVAPAEPLAPAEPAVPGEPVAPLLPVWLRLSIG